MNEPNGNGIPGESFFWLVLFCLIMLLVGFLIYGLVKLSQVVGRYLSGYRQDSD
jgi:flagellar biogenesis protein FliO